VEGILAKFLVEALLILVELGFFYLLQRFGFSNTAPAAA
jgi:hypothetical protein